MTLNEFKAFVAGVLAAGSDDSRALKLILEKLKTVSEPQQSLQPVWAPRTTDKYYGPGPFDGVVGEVNTARTARDTDDPYDGRLVSRG